MVLNCRIGLFGTAGPALRVFQSPLLASFPLDLARGGLAKANCSHKCIHAW